MNSLSLWIEKNKKKPWLALGLNLLFLIGIFLLMRPFYETNDDVTMMEFINGAYQVRDAHLVFQNYLLGMLYKLLYYLPGRLPWYGACQYLFLWLSFSGITYVLLQRMQSAAALCVAGLYLIYFGYGGYVCMQFSKVAGIVTAAGLFLLFYAVTQEKFSKPAAVCGWILGCVGSMYRFDEFLACSALMTGIGLFLLLELTRISSEKRLNRLLRYVGTFAVMVVLAFALRFFDNYMYSSDPVWKYYNDYNEVRYRLFDYGLPSYKENQEVYEELGIDEDAYKLYSSWNFYDPDKFTIEVMERLLELRQEKELDSSTVTGFLKSFPRRFFEVHTFYVIPILLALWLFYGNHSLSAVLAVAYELMLHYGLYFYLYYQGRYLINRVDVGLWAAQALVLIWLLSGEKMKISWQTCWVLCAGVLALNQKIWREDWRFNTQQSQAGQISERTLVEILASDKDHLYLAMMGNISVGDSYGPFNRMMAGVMDNLCWLGGWEVNTVGYLDTLHRYGVENPYRDVIGNEQVYLIDSDIDLTMRYIHTYYDENATATLVKEIMGCRVYQIGGGDETTEDMD